MKEKITKINFLCFGNPAQLKALTKQVGKQHIVTSIKDLSEVNNYLASEDYTHICILDLDTDYIKESFMEIIKDYDESNTMYMPIVELIEDVVKEGDKEKFLGFLNTCMLKAGMNEGDLGTMDYDLSQKQIDLYINGSLIPVNCGVTFDMEVKYYTGLNFINKFAANTPEQFVIKSIPKILLKSNCDFTLKDIPVEEKRKYFLEAKSAGIELVEEPIEG